MQGCYHPTRLLYYHQFVASIPGYLPEGFEVGDRKRIIIGPFAPAAEVVVSQESYDLGHVLPAGGAYGRRSFRGGSFAGRTSPGSERPGG